jgi:Domain of unknown function (DUF4105)
VKLLPALVLIAAFAPPRVFATPTSPEPGSDLTVYVMTFGPGREVWERFGHNAIWIHDPTHGTDQAFNYGLFDFRQENFILRFVRGQMWYWMAGFPAESYVRQYERDNRSVWVQELDIPPAARLDLQQFLQWNEQPDHKFYHYDYYRDNCSTRVRDALDRVVGGAIQRQTASLPAGTTFRFHTQRLTANTPLIFTGLLLALGERVDRPISAWEEMFIPLAMRDHLRRVRVAGAGGADVPLVKTERTLFESTAPTPPDSPPNWILRYLAIGLAIGAGAFGLAGMSRTGGRARTAFFVLATGWTLLAGLAGVILAGLWGLTDHVMAACNENLLQLNPLSLALLPLLPGSLRGTREAAFARALAVGISVLSLAGLAIQLLPWFEQVNGPVIALAVPAHLGVALALRRLR